MIVSVTTLGAKAGAVGSAADHIVGYLEGDQASKRQRTSDSPSRGGSAPPEVDGITSGLSTSGQAHGYYADSAEATGRWRGRGAATDGFDLGTDVEAEAFRRVLLGQDPHSGEQLLSAAGSAGRSRGHARGPSKLGSDPTEMLTMAQVAQIAGVDVSYVRRLAANTAEVRRAQEAANRSGEVGPETPASFLDAHKDAQGRWVATRGEAERFAAGRSEPQVVLGYDITWSVPKSVSAVYAQGTDKDREAIDEAIESAVTAGMDYLEREGFHVRRNGVRERADQMVAASYRHYTNRALEPHLHEHVVVANMARNSLGETRAVGARGLFAHATTAGYLAAAELRTEFADRLGVTWADVNKGIADISGVDRSTIMAISSRRQALMTLAEEMGYLTPAGRQKAALATRPSKEQPVDAAELHNHWRGVLAEAGFDAVAVESLRGRDELQLWSPIDTEALFSHLASHRGVTEQMAIFDRRDVLQAIATYANDRLPAVEIEDLADQWLGTEAVIPLEVNDGARRETIGLGAAQVSLTPDEQRYTTPQMVELEERTLNRHRAGIDTGHGVVDAVTVEAAISESTVELGADQAAMVRAICTSGDQFQAVIGRAGAGKTTALRAAVAAWEDAGFSVIGAAPFAEAARNLETETGLHSTTLAGLLTRIETAGDPRTLIGPNAVIVVDEASTIGNRQLDRLYRHAAETGATVRTIGDPHQHQSVEAGGLWKHITSEHPQRTPTLEINRRQSGPDMGEVRLALDEYRDVLISAAMQRLDNDSRIVTATNWEELLDTMATDWFVDHQRHQAGAGSESKMIAERNSDRHALNRRAQALLHQAELIGDPALIEGTPFHVGDRVVAQARNSDLHADGAPKRDHVINGSQGTVTAIKGQPAGFGLVVDFDDLGTIRVPHEFITTEVGPGRGGGVTPAYAVTSFKAEGQTYDSGRNLAAPGAVNTEGMYVALTRGRNDQRTYTIAPEDHVAERPELPVIADDRTAIEALAQSLSKQRGADLATVADPQAASTLHELTHAQADIGGRALSLAESRIASSAVNNPDPSTVAALGPRPTVGQHRTTWDAAVGDAAIYHARWGTEVVSVDGSVEPPLSSDGPARHKHFGRVQPAVRAAGIEHLTRLPLGQLLAERHAASTALPSSATHSLQQAQDELTAARSDLTAAQTEFEVAQANYHSTQAGPSRRRRNPNAAEASRRDRNEATSRVAKAERAVSTATGHVGASRGNSDDRVVVQARIAAIDRALDRRIDNAGKRPAAYLIETLGKRPRTENESRRWDKAATSIETYRHHHLGISPEDGPRRGRGLHAAIGAQPDNHALRLRFWKQTQRHVEEHLSPPIDREHALQRTR